MYTQCPECRKIYEISKEQLLENCVIFCEGCSAEFNAFVLLSDILPEVKRGANIGDCENSGSKTKSRPKKKFKRRRQGKKNLILEDNSKPDNIAVGQVAETSMRETLPWEIEKAPISVNWYAGFMLGCLVLAGQLIFFETKNLTQNASYRPKLEIIANWFGYTLPAYQNINELELLQGSLGTNDGGKLWFKAAINNQAAFEQKLPNIELELLDNDGQVFAERIFVPKEYLANGSRTNFFIAPDETVQASLQIAMPKTSMGGYHFDITYKKQ